MSDSQSRRRGDNCCKFPQSAVGLTWPLVRGLVGYYLPLLHSLNVSEIKCFLKCFFPIFYSGRMYEVEELLKLRSSELKIKVEKNEKLLKVITLVLLIYNFERLFIVGFFSSKSHLLGTAHLSNYSKVL